MSPSRAVWPEVATPAGQSAIGSCVWLAGLMDQVLALLRLWLDVRGPCEQIWGREGVGSTIGSSQLRYRPARDRVGSSDLSRTYGQRDRDGIAGSLSTGCDF